MKTKPKVGFHLILLSILTFCIAFQTIGQKSNNPICERMLDDANILAKKKEFRKALNKYNAAKTCDEGLSQIVNEKILELFKAVNKEKQDAIDQRKRADIQTIIAKSQRDTALIKAEANRISASALEIQKNNPTLAAYLADYAYKLSWDENPLAAKIRRNVFQEFKSKPFYVVQLIGHLREIREIAYSPDGNRILTGSTDNTLILWDLEGNKLQRFFGHESFITDLAFFPNGKYCLSSSTDSVAFLWDLKGNISQKLVGHKSRISSVAISPDSEIFLTGSYDYFAILWDMHIPKRLTPTFRYTDPLP